MAGSYPVHTDTPQSHLWSEMYHRLDIFLLNHIHSDMWSVIRRTDRSSVSPTVYSAHSHFHHSSGISYVHFVDQIQHFHHSLHIYKSYCYLLLFLPLYKRFCVHYFVSITHSMHSKNRPYKQAIFHHYIISMVFSYIVFVFLSHLSFPGILYSIKKIGGIYHEWFISNTVRLWKKWNVWFWWRQQLLLHHHPSSSLLLLRKWFWKWLWLWRRK